MVCVKNVNDNKNDDYDFNGRKMLSTIELNSASSTLQLNFYKMSLVRAATRTFTNIMAKYRFSSEKQNSGFVTGEVSKSLATKLLSSHSF